MKSKGFRLKVFAGIFVCIISACSQKSSQDKNSGPISSELSQDAALNVSYTLPRDIVLGDCPFKHKSFSLEPIIKIIQAQLEAKVAGDSMCESKKRALYEHLNAIHLAFTNEEEMLKSKKGIEVYENFLRDLQAQYDAMKLEGSASTTEGYTLYSNILDLKSGLNRMYLNSEVTETSNRLQSQSEMFQYANSAIVNLVEMDSKCVNSMGGWQQILPPVLGVASLASSYSVFAGQAMGAAILQISSNLTRLFANQDAKQALQEITRLSNEHVFACTYFTLQNATCEIRRGITLAEQNKDKLRLVSAGAPLRLGKEPKEWADLLQAQFKASQFEGIFNAIASQGSSQSLDVSLVKSYFLALKIGVRDLPKLDPLANDQEKSDWMSKVGIAGINTSTTDNFGNPLTLNEQVKRAQTDIDNYINVMNQVERDLRKNKSFEGLSHYLKSQFPQTLPDAQQMSKYLKEQQKTLPKSDRAPVAISGLAMDKIVGFLNVELNENELVEVINPATGVKELKSNLDVYQDDLMTAGIELFKVISMGAVAQISQQQILALGSKAQERLINALKIIENRYVTSDVANQTPYENSFTNFSQENSLLFELSNFYSDLVGTGAVGRDREIATAYGAFEGGFRPELLDMIDQTLSLKSSIAPELQDATAPHLCAMMADFLRRDDTMRSRSLLKKCRSRFSDLAIKTLSYESNEKIQWENSCFYPAFIRKDRGIRALDWAKRNWPAGP